MRRWGRVLLGALIALLAMPSASAFAHSNLLSSDPADGSVLKTAPPYADLHFSEDVLVAASKVTLIHLGPGTTQTLQISGADGGSTIRATLPALGDGAYLLRFVAVDPADLHTTTGTVSFGIGVDAPPTEAGSQIDSSWWVTALRAATDGVLVVGIGAVLVIWLSVRRGAGGVQRSAMIATACAVATSIGWIVLFVLDVGTVGFANARWGRLLFASDPGRRALVGVELALGMWWTARFMWTVVASSRELIARILAVIAAGLVLLAAFGGHSNVGGNDAVGTLLRTVHFSSFCLWIGSVVVVWWVARVEPEVKALWPSVSRIAAFGLALTGASGLLLSGRSVATVTAMFDTRYGRAILGKMVVLVLLGAFGWGVARRVARGRAPARLPVEFVLAGVAVVCAAVLASSAPAVGARFDPLPEVVPQIVTNNVADLTVSTLLQPARPGPNLLRVSVLDTRRPSPGTIEQVTMTLVRADGTVVATRTGAPAGGPIEWADVEIVAPGSYTVRVRIDRPAQPVPDFTGAWTVAPTPVPRAATIVSNRSWAPIALVAAALWVLLVGFGRWWVQRHANPSLRFQGPRL